MTKNILLLLVGIIIFFGVILFYLIVGTRETRVVKIKHSLNQMQSHLTGLDNTYSKYFQSICSNDSGVIKLDNSENLLKSLEDWKAKRLVIINKYSKSNFAFNTTSIRIFGSKKDVNALSELDKNLRSFDILADDVLKNAIKDCKEVNTLPEKTYMNPVKSKTCLVECKYINEFQKNILNLSRKEQVLIDNTIVTLSKSD